MASKNGNNEAENKFPGEKKHAVGSNKYSAKIRWLRDSFLIATRSRPTN
jgi:hypothetical protein